MVELSQHGGPEAVLAKVIRSRVGQNASLKGRRSSWFQNEAEAEEHTYMSFIQQTFTEYHSLPCVGYCTCFWIHMSLTLENTKHSSRGRPFFFFFFFARSIQYPLWGCTKNSHQNEFPMLKLAHLFPRMLYKLFVIFYLQLILVTQLSPRNYQD